MVLKIQHNYGTFLLFVAILLSMGTICLSLVFVEETEHQCKNSGHKTIASLGTGIMYMSILSLMFVMYIIFNHSS